MLKKVLLSSVISLSLAISLNAKDVTKDECIKKGENFIYSSSECIEYVSFEGDSNEHIMVIVHGTWDEGTNTLGRYAPFAETMNMNTDLTTIAVALPGYSNSSENKFKSLANKQIKNQAAKKEYVLFVGDLIEDLKKKFEASKVTFVGHSAGARMGATLMGLKPQLISNIALAGGRYEVRDENKNKDLISMMDVLKDVNKDANYLFIYGTKDKISKPEVTTKFYELAKKSGLNAKLIKVDGASHIDLDMTDESVEAITAMVEEE